ncbi:type I restriction enzyme HsdR N-terminal domain-containing protein [Intestinibacter bartlettii]|uniref:type I restriction enzyme HsdR N-terminal domain-containing protein n=1 Tax=Intestinibacter bartlettii TaxID=261299 RepID=UPI00352271C8
MNIYQIVSKYKLNFNYKRNGVACCFDESRKIFVQKTPEEVVRQQTIKFLKYQLKVPEKMIDTEVNLKEYGLKSRKRIDIAINEIDQNNELYTVAIVECKSNNTSLTNKVFTQAAQYADELYVDYIFITNGIDMLAFHYSEDDQQYHKLKNLPTYDKIIQNKTKQSDYAKDFKINRTPYKKLFTSDIDSYDKFYMIGQDTPNKLKPFIINLGECFLDESRKFPQKSFDGIKVLEDCGLRYMSYGNASGGSYNTLYRTLIIEDSFGNNQLISFCVVASAKCHNDPLYGNCTGKSVLIVSIDDFNKSHNSLQLNMNNFLNIVDNSVTITHNGAIAVGNIGSGKISELKKFIRNKYPKLLNNSDEIVLGKIENNKLLYMDQIEIQHLIVNLIKYALVRDEYRDYVKKLHPKK